jgi:hypothetical protein
MSPRHNKMVDSIRINKTVPITFMAQIDGNNFVDWFIGSHNISYNSFGQYYDL